MPLAARPQEPVVPAAQATAAVTEPLELTIEQAVATALENDLTLELEEIAGEIANFTFEGSWGSFDPVWTAAASFSDSQSESNQSFFGVSVLEQQTLDMATGLRLPITSGGSFSFDVSQVRSDTNTPVAVVNPSFSNAIAVSFTQPLLRGAGSSFATSVQRENEVRYRKQVERIRQARQDLIKQVADAYWDLDTAIEQLAAADETLSLGREQLDQNQRRLAAGVGTEVEVLQADANVAQRIEQRLLQETAVKGAADKLKGLLYPGTDVGTWEREIKPVTALPDSDSLQVPEWREALAIALANRSELRQQVLEIDATEEQLVRARSERKPLLDFVISSRSEALEGNEGDALGSAATWDFPTNSAALSFSFPIGNRSARYSELSARAALRSARLSYDLLESQIVAEVRDAVRVALYSVEAVHAAEVSRELARRQLAAEQARYREGLSTNYQVLEFQQKLAESLYSHTRARANFAKAMTALLRAQGQIGERKR